VWRDEADQLARSVTRSTAGPGRTSRAGVAQISLHRGNKRGARTGIPRAADGRTSQVCHVALERMLAFAVPSDFNHERIEAIAALANLELDPSEVEMFARQLGEILAYAEEVQQVDTKGVPPTAAVAGAPRREREDEVQPSLDVHEALANAPDAVPAGLLRVPRVFG
jgi:aspartyl-tRNA(Asn)/glutamyl-tRNA(Gln) amidotransferase subunit C